MSTLLGVPITRVDGKAKVTGTAQYAAEADLPNLAYAALVLSTIPKGIIERIDTSSASGLPGPKCLRMTSGSVSLLFSTRTPACAASWVTKSSSSVICP